MTVRLTITPGPGAHLLEHLEQDLGDKVNTAGLEGEAVAKQLAPVDTGYHRNSIGWTMTDETAGETAASGVCRLSRVRNPQDGRPPAYGPRIRGREGHAPRPPPPPVGMPR